MKYGVAESHAKLQLRVVLHVALVHEGLSALHVCDLNKEASMGTFHALLSME